MRTPNDVHVHGPFQGFGLTGEIDDEGNPVFSLLACKGEEGHTVLYLSTREFATLCSVMQDGLKELWDMAAPDHGLETWHHVKPN